MTVNVTNPELASQRPSCILVYVCLDNHGPCDLAELQFRTSLAESTTRDAVNDLLDAGIIDQTPTSTRPEYDTIG